MALALRPHGTAFTGLLAVDVPWAPMSFVTDDFLLHGRAARELYHTHAAGAPILDYHCHLPVRDLATNRRFENLFDIWLEGVHYKWRAMRANGIAERYCTGDAPPYEKFLAWARTVPQTLRNPLYHWTHLELRRYFDIDELLSERTAGEVWSRANRRLADGDLTAQGILRRFRVAYLCTSDDPVDPLTHHAALAASPLDTAVYPTFRPDAALRVGDAAGFNRWTDALAAAANVQIARLPDFLEALRRRHDDFHAHGCRLSDHGLEQCPLTTCAEAEAARIFDRVRAGSAADPLDADRFAGYLMMFFGRLDARRGWTKQLHLGALRNVNTRMQQTLGRDTGFDSIGDWPQLQRLAAYLDALEREQALPRTILYNVNPADNYAFATLAGCFQDGRVAGKIQFGSGWWFLDQREGIEWQLNALSNAGLLSRWVGMVTDSRSFMSYPRHEYFRRVLCNLIGTDVDRGELPNEPESIGELIRNLCFETAHRYLNLPARAKTGGAG
jgi:glucuronate isomerase